MSEAAFQALLPIVYNMETLLQAGCFSWFVGSLYYTKSSRRIGTGMCFVLYTLFFMLKMTVLDVPAWIGLFCIFIIMGTVSRIKRNGRAEYLLYLIITWYCLRNLSFLMETSLKELADRTLLSGISNTKDIYLYMLFLSIAGISLRSFLVFLMSLLLIKKISRSMDNIQGKELLNLLLVPVAGVLFGSMISSILFRIKEEIYFRMYGEFPMFLWIVPVIALIFYLGIWFSVSSYSSMIALQEERKKNFVEEQQIRALKNRMEEVEQFYDTARRMKHEMRGHITAIRGLLAKGNLDEADHYMIRIYPDMESFPFSIKTGNAVTDVIINDTKKKAEELEIVFVSDFHFEKAMGIEAFDLGIVISNLLGNALEACGKQARGEKWIQITGKRRKKFFLLEVKNSFEGVIRFHEKTGLPVSIKKEEKSLHGIGLENVSRIAEKYLGSMEIKAEKNVFCVTVFMQEKEAQQ